MKDNQVSLKLLIDGIITFSVQQDIPIKSLVLDSRQATPGSLFFAYPGASFDGRHYIKQAIAQGASAIIYEATDGFMPPLAHESSTCFIPAEHVQAIIGLIAARFYGEPSQHMRVIGVTGTNGKTSSCLFLAAALHEAQQPVGLLGTVGNGLYGDLKASTHTTLDAITLQQTLAEFYEQGVKHVVMEVSSHALCQGRVNGVCFDTAIFTNLSHDHLDYHGDFANYAAAKRRLFNFPKLRTAIINGDDMYGQHWLQELSDKVATYAYSLNAALHNVLQTPLIVARTVQLSTHGMTAQVESPWGNGILQARQLGRFNLSNLLAVFSALGAGGMPIDRILAKLANLPSVPGRMETYGGQLLPTVIVDYAHTPDALKQVLITLRELCGGKLWCIFGCGGDRDKSKRPLMGEIVERYADTVIVTDDNPRFEDPKAIVKDILQGLQQPQAAIIEHDRARAIAHAINCAQPADIILVAGKGHESYQIVGEQKLLFSDALTAKRLLAER